MSRTVLDCPDAPVLKADELHPDTITKTYTTTVITPLFGGGVEAGMNDPTTLIRPSSVRGHLRFWWRATRGARFQTIAELRQREGEIWGTTDNPSPISIEVKITNLGEEEACATGSALDAFIAFAKEKGFQECTP